MDVALDVEIEVQPSIVGKASVMSEAATPVASPGMGGKESGSG